MTVYTCGQHLPAPIYEFLTAFYDDFGMDRSIRTRYFHVPQLPEATQLYADISAVSPTYIVVHQQSSMKTLPIWDSVNQKNPTALIVDVNTNHYPEGHRFHAACRPRSGQAPPPVQDSPENAAEILIFWRAASIALPATWTSRP
jgi:hypothetical protein